MRQHILLPSKRSLAIRRGRLRQLQVLCYWWLVGGWLLQAPGAWAQGQTATQDLLPPKFIPKSPTVTAFQRFDTQQFVNLPTGGAQLSVPLADVTCGALHLPVSLSYSYTGLQVGQPYELVGLGWALQAGCSITRQVNGLVDEPLASNARRYDPDSIRVGINRPTFLKRAYLEEVDLGPDLYSFSLPNGSSGRFVLRDTTVVLFPQQPLHIRALRAGGFQITTEEGVRYQFQATEFTNPNPNNFGNVTLHTSAWHLSRLISADNIDTVRLHYSTYGFERLPQQCSVTTGRYYTGRYQLFGNVVDQNGPDYACGSTADYSFHNVRLLVSRVQAQYLDSITTRDTHLLLGRADSTQHHQLTRVRLVATLQGRREIRRFTLYQSIFSGETTTIDYRLRLDSLREQANGIRLPPYRFRYHEEVPLPSRASAAQDYWGYANGASANGDIATTYRPTLLADPHLRVAGITPADRAPNFAYAQAGALHNVIYPTGGTTQWEYEPGRLASDADDIPLDTLSAEVGGGYNPAHTLPLYGGSKKYTPSGKITFQVPEEQNVLVTLERQPFDTEHNYGNSNTYRDFNIWRRLPSGDTLITNIPDDVAPNAYRVRDPNAIRRFLFHLVPGTYVAQVYCEELEASTGVTFHIPYHDSSQVKLGMLGPGIRVRQTATSTLGAPPLIRSYHYAFGISLLAQYGKGFDTYTNYASYASGGQAISTGTTCQYVSTSSDNKSLGDEFNKYAFYYNHVTETDGVNQGTTVSNYTNLVLQFNDVVPTSTETYRYDTPRRLQQLVQQTRYTYATDSIFSYPLLRVRVAISNAGNAIGSGDTYSPTQYQVRTAFLLPVLTEQVSYDAQGIPHTTLTRSTYQRQRLVRTATRTSTGWNIQRYKRLYEYAALPAVTALRVNFFNPVVETQTWRRPLTGTDSLLVAGHITLYHPLWRSPASRYRLRLDQPQAHLNQETQVNGRFTTLLSDTRYELEASVRYAAGSGDLIQQQATHGSPTSFLTGYAHTLVIGEAKNAAYNQLACTSFEPDATGRWRYDSTGTHRVLGGRTGHWAYLLDGTTSIVRPQLPAGDYAVDYWVQSPNSPTLAVSGGRLLAAGPQLIATAPNNWYQFHARVQLTTLGQVALQGSAGSSSLRVDEVRLYPVGAQLTSYTHNPLVGMTSQTGPDGRITFYEYDGLGRLVRTRDEQNRILSQQQYHYAQP